jgi:hypothetical protein
VRAAIIRVHSIHGIFRLSRKRARHTKFKCIKLDDQVLSLRLNYGVVLGNPIDSQYLAIVSSLVRCIPCAPAKVTSRTFFATTRTGRLHARRQRHTTTYIRTSLASSANNVHPAYRTWLGLLTFLQRPHPPRDAAQRRSAFNAKCFEYIIGRYSTQHTYTYVSSGMLEFLDTAFLFCFRQPRLTTIILPRAPACRERAGTASKYT